MAQFSFKRHHDANILNDKHVVCTVKCWRHGCNHVVFNVKLGHAALILNRLLRLCLCLCLCSEFAKSLITKNWNRLQITLNQVNILNWREPHQFSSNSFRLVLRQTNKRWRREKVTTPGSQNLACLVRLYSGGQWTIAEAKLTSSLCIGMNRRCPFPLYFIPR